MSLVRKSLKVIKNLQLKNGGILATLKEDAYPYIYPRDGTIMCKALNLHGRYKQSQKFFYFIKNRVERYGEIFQRYNEDGLPFVTRKHEHDIMGIVLHGIHNTFTVSHDTKFLRDMWPLIKNLTSHIERDTDKKTGLIYTERSIHEFFRLENGFEIWANSACCRGLLDASILAKELGKNKEAIKFKIRHENLKKNIERKLFDRRRKVFIKTLRTDRTRINIPDVSLLSPFYFNIIDSKNLLKSTLDLLIKTLWNRKLGGFNRFRKFEFVKDWHWYTGGHGAFPQFTLLASAFYHKINDFKTCIRCSEWAESIATKDGFLPEHIALKEEYDEWFNNDIEFNDRLIKGVKRAEKFKNLKKGIMYWATPLGWANAEYILVKNLL